MEIFQNPVFVLGILCLNAFICDYLSRKTFLKPLGTALMVIILTAITANLGVIPSASNSIPLYGGIFQYLAPLSIFYLLLEVRLEQIRKIGPEVGLLFFLGVLGTCLGVFAGLSILSSVEVFGEDRAALAGMFTGTYTGGSLNFNAIALHYKVMENGPLYAGAVAVDNIVTALWMLICIALPKLRRKKSKLVQTLSSKPPSSSNIPKDSFAFSYQLGLLLALGLFTLNLSDYLALQLSSLGFEIPSILILSTIALVLAQFPYFQQFTLSHELGLFAIYLFLAVIGAYCELEALSNIGSLAFSLSIFVLTIISVHGLLVFGGARLLGYDWESASVASQANIGGGSTALALSESFNRPDLLLPAILLGSIGTALGTYLGFMVAAWIG